MSLIEVKIPPLGESISSGVLAKWHVADGDVVKKDQPLFELETDKITSEGVAESAGKITFKVQPGTEVKIGEVVATIDSSAAGATPAPAAAAPAAKEAAPAPAKTAASTEQSPAVRRVAAETNIDVSKVEGTGKAGRVTKGDVLAAAESAPKASTVSAAVAAAPSSALPASAPVVTAPATGRRSRVKMSKLRQTIAKRLVSAQHEAAMLTTFNEVDMSAVMELRKKYQDDFVKKNGVKLGFMSFFTKAVVQALKDVPAINAQLDGDEVIQNHYFDISMAVSTEKGLVVPVVRDCDKLDMAGIEKAIGEVAKKARDGKLGLPDFEGGCFTITNGGIFGSMLSTPIINAPQSAILGLHAINDRPVALNGQVVIRPMMYLALSYDHRLVDGKEAVTFLVKIKQAIEDPTRLLLSV
ncbi:2-oxoglutarate dehydrogenase complex dihydrolipoyllysine-residue succinyltransferase [Rariglobus hedericola]|uniref:Dihydrolipoyllysine-residue succinyltransferase component of 2-oxoglutarate dehydrogenase complex n=1 Tax=Rariglobus hedericola TaxID=2597822 RepID=A0A556QLE9_9BACT|nr:2-oxoglutarate dehydrogenase complex dihydrolipoyllysine-residue succinyltransferase [Rariglobus hedericola]TSJ77479.1 2-oxoglutarate dehydrogenase complex dihydrolipoyllysine-residue succinyltransferase [Rariglobus hedericola]